MVSQRKFYCLLLVVVVLDLVSGLSLVPSSSQNLQSKANYSCYSCPLSEAKSIEIVYNKHVSIGDFWYRNGSALASCDFSFIYESKRKCSVCLSNKTVVMVLCNLTSGEELIFEGEHGDISFKETSCPQPEHIDLLETSLSERDATETNRGSEGPLILAGCLLAVVFIGLIIMIIIIKSQKSPADASSTNSSDPENGPGV